ncbi:hypothetical protein PHYBLDRAFT_141380 [Phycomyces blakesleeanus NRRL 1555(-)]|uniref:Uncharacterized protein n=1 Tax=Phycomyces blakesleeanus (strain ATCC 8743b / DSM 1359 / FGSC 10004 / NBRC 33097 / NRRL 1555) TaxID=763407 RepID=A0A162US15_PHYB8|nr:hypothetical protein PHYBLDRAFT_141380 [Phycomyces blakesleeanus NRRL 1555(-)]OAD77493.1 hypothetical protein PHYBLDRAFT_141380 [Phycomyces blakesleeanus NRRL 1555(-)]|eukprot:XP_018295533.1 hypothetical protein PHYBLDRAFT_141380 [Phycomyces blakesleeanus NRRL 1555(-)]
MIDMCLVDLLSWSWENVLHSTINIANQSKLMNLVLPNTVLSVPSLSLKPSSKSRTLAHIAALKRQI